MRLLKPCPVIVISSFTVPVDGLMLLTDGEKHLGRSNRNLPEFLTSVWFRSHRGSVARQPVTELPKCKFTGPPLDERTACQSRITFENKNCFQAALLYSDDGGLQSGKPFFFFFFLKTRRPQAVQSYKKDLDKGDTLENEHKINFSICLRPDPMGTSHILTYFRTHTEC